MQINPGVDDKNRVAELIGTPSTISTFDDRTWYYICKRTETTAFFDPDVIDQEILVVKFDDSGVVAEYARSTAWKTADDHRPSRPHHADRRPASSRSSSSCSATSAASTRRATSAAS